MDGYIQSHKSWMEINDLVHIMPYCTCSLTDLPTDYTYTGQKNAPEIGLMFYNARWYDPAIAHFTQADSLIPGAGSPQAWDRYAYVFNNPLKYTDPSGHNPRCGPDGVYCDDNQWNDFGFEVEITPGGQLIIDIGLALEKMLRDNDQPGRISLKTVIRLIFEREFSDLRLNKYSDQISDVFSEAVGRGYWHWATHQYKSHSPTTLINWLGAHNASARSVHNLLSTTSIDYILGEKRDYYKNFGVASKIASRLLNISNEWQNFNPKAPYSWGNCVGQDLCMINNNLRDTFYGKSIPDTSVNSNTGLLDFKTDEANFYFRFSNFYIDTFEQIRYWEGK